MIHAGANAGVYGLREMAFESVEGFLRAGGFKLSLYPRERVRIRELTFPTSLPHHFDFFSLSFSDSFFSALAEN